ncbi:MAG: SGNH/GDSL hydrolase family protein [Bacteroidales bacterium]
MKKLSALLTGCCALTLSFTYPVFGQKVADLKFTDVQQAVVKGEMVILGQGFEMAPDKFFSRLPSDIEGTVRKDVWDLGRCSAGIAVRFRSNSKCIGAKWTLLNNFNMAHMAGTGIRGLDLYAFVNGEWLFAGTAQPNGRESANIFRRNMDGEYRDYIMYLPLYDGVEKLEIGIDSGAVLCSAAVRSLFGEGKPIVFYGTSVTQGGCASRPGMAYPAIVERRLNKETMNLGFSGNGRMDKVLADKIATIDASAYVIDCLANCTAEIVRDSTEYFIKTIAGAHLQTPVYMVSNYCYPYQYLDAQFRKDLEQENALWYSLYKKLREEGYKNLKYIDLYSKGNMGKSAAGPDHEGTVDGVHLTDLGFLRLAEVFCKFL